MKKCVFWILCLFVYQVSMAQENRKSFDFIVCVDEEIATSLTKPVIIAKQGTNVLKRIDISYHAGNLSLSSEDYNMLFSEQEITLFLQFDYYQYSSKGKQEIYNYEIEIGKNWFEKTFVILKIYNLDKKKYKKRLYPLSKDKNYTFDLETSEGQMIRIRKR
ncbi:hypothetical protein MM213_00095 [Belliella sp. R4-6]|uniref:Uncharacterized protein n=1 Tax=Belliella alkalica TaxID=1730871 RepID=A0ABS9V663_9BACT|nr:hypothetical protein [Belliella alkalica]MCH7411868.1 hypothetical protein [Belliella alkalica]